MKLVVISPESSYPSEEEITTHMFKHGLYRFHLRKPQWTKDQMENYLDNLDTELHKKIYIHSHFDLLKKYNLAGAHRASLHKLNELEKPFTAEYVFLSPIFDSISKKGYKTAFTYESLKAALEKNKNRVFALGGITAKKIESCRALGFSGVACLGAVWQSDDPCESFFALQKECLA